MLEEKTSYLIRCALIDNANAQIEKTKRIVRLIKDEEDCNSLDSRHEIDCLSSEAVGAVYTCINSLLDLNIITQRQRDYVSDRLDSAFENDFIYGFDIWKCIREYYEVKK